MVLDPQGYPVGRSVMQGSYSGIINSMHCTKQMSFKIYKLSLLFLITIVYLLAFPRTIISDSQLFCQGPMGDYLSFILSNDMRTLIKPCF